MKRPLAAFLFSALLGVLSFPPIGWWPLAWVALIPFLVAATSLKLRRPFWKGYFGGFVFFGGILYWIGRNSGAPALLSWASVVAMVAILATIWGLTSWAVCGINRRFGLRWAVLLFVTLYIFLEVFWGTGEMGLPWAIWALSQTNCRPILQLADIGDVYGISLWVISTNALLFLVWKDRSRRARWLGLAIALIIAALTYGRYRLQTFTRGDSIAVAAVQANTDVAEKWSLSAEDILESHLRESTALIGTGTRLMVWPETATPMPLRFRGWARDRLHSFVDSTGMALLTGATDYESDPVKGMLPYNAAFLIRPGNPDIESCAKVHLVPFGERIPGQKLLPALGSIRLGQAEFTPGKSVVTFPARDALPALGCLICFEVVFPEIAAEMVQKGATLLTTITNDGWYGNSSGPYQHLALARLRAVAVRRSLVRSANTGISALILPTGDITKSLSFGRRGVIHGSLPLQSEITLAARLSRVWLPLYSALLGILLIVLLIKARRTARVTA